MIDDGQAIPDQWGVDLADLSEARQQAQALLPNIARERLPTKNRRDLSVVVRFSEGQPCYKLALTIEGEWINPNGV